MKANTIPDSVHIRKTTRPGNLLGGGGVLRHTGSRRAVSLFSAGNRRLPSSLLALPDSSGKKLEENGFAILQGRENYPLGLCNYMNKSHQQHRQHQRLTNILLHLLLIHVACAINAKGWFPGHRWCR